MRKSANGSRHRENSFDSAVADLADHHLRISRIAQRPLPRHAFPRWRRHVREDDLQFRIAKTACVTQMVAAMWPAARALSSTSLPCFAVSALAVLRS